MGLVFEGGIRAVMVGREGELFCLRFEGGQTVYELLEQNGHLPLPPYIERAADADDDSRYQTVYAKYQGAVASRRRPAFYGRTFAPSERQRRGNRRSNPARRCGDIPTRARR